MKKISRIYIGLYSAQSKVKYKARVYTQPLIREFETALNVLFFYYESMFCVKVIVAFSRYIEHPKGHYFTVGFDMYLVSLKITVTVCPQKMLFSYDIKSLRHSPNKRIVI